MTKTSKNVLATVIDLEVSKGHLKWKVTDLARYSKVGRELIYYHFGRTKKAILEKSFELIAEEFYGLTEDRIKLIQSGDLGSSLRQTHKMFLENPSFGLFYLKWRTTPSPIQATCISLEKRYEKKLQNLFPHLTKDQVEALHSILHGMATAPFLSNKGLAAATRWLEEILRP
jgi:AcrR family transcriptional regulator